MSDSKLNYNELDKPNEYYWKSGFPAQKNQNPFVGEKIERFIPADILQRSESNKTTDYENKLIEAASRFIKDNLTKEVVDGVNPVHPFIEIGGSLRVEVPLPKTMKELYVLTYVILGNKTTGNAQNSDKWRMPVNGFFDQNNLPGSSFAVKIGTGKVQKKYQGNQIPITRGLLVWDDVGGESGINKTACPNLLILLCSMLYQQIDELEYGKRGRYGPNVCQRLLSCHAGPVDKIDDSKLDIGEDGPDRTVTVFAFDMNTGMPYGFYTGSFLEPTATLKKSKNAKVRVPALLLNWTFVPNDRPGNGEDPTTTSIIAHLLKYGSEWVTGLPPHYHLVSIHTDKCRAAKSTEKLLTVKSNEIAEEIYTSVALKVWHDITADRRNSYKSSFFVPEMKLLMVDESTVDPGDPGEEVPVRSDRFYRAIYPTYLGLVQKYEKNWPMLLMNGKLNANNLSSLQSDFGIDAKTIITWLQTPGSLQYNFPYTGPVSEALLLKDMTVSSNMRINEEGSWQDLNMDSKNAPQLDENMKYPFRKKLNTILIAAAKNGNTANFNHYTDGSNSRGRDKNKTLSVPRLTDLAFILVGDVSSSSFLGNKASQIRYDAMAQLEGILTLVETPIEIAPIKSNIEKKWLNIAGQPLNLDQNSFTEAVLLIS